MEYKLEAQKKDREGFWSTATKRDGFPAVFSYDSTDLSVKSCRMMFDAGMFGVRGQKDVTLFRVVVRDSNEKLVCIINHEGRWVSV